jgi:hypothetical protein
MRSWTKRSFRPRLEALEQRWVPAAVRDVAGLLLISNPQGALTVTVTSSPGVVNVQDSSGAGTFTGVGTLISITGTNGNDSIAFRGGSGFNGNLLINTQNGNDAVSVTGPVGGYVTILTGVGSDSTSLSGRIGSNLTYFHRSGANTVTITGATTVGGEASLSLLGTLAINSSLTVGGNLSISGNPTSGTPLNVHGAGNLTVNKSLYVTGSNGANSFSLTGVLKVTGNAIFNFYAAGGGSLNLSGVAPGSFIGGSLHYSGGAGGDSLSLGDNLTVGGDAILFLGNGVGTFTSTVADTINGNLEITTGNGNNAFTVAGTVAGFETIKVGNGTDNVTVDNAPGGLFTFQGGNGTDALTLGAGTTQFFNVYLSFGTGTSTLNLNAADTVTGNILGLGSSDTLNQNNAILLDIYFQDYAPIDWM